jgi:hypothetical protein
MADPTFRLTNIFSGPDHGASESWYFTNPSVSPLTALAAVVSLGPKRAALLGKEWGLKAVRCELVTLANGTPVTRQSYLDKTRYASNQSQPAAPSNISLQCICTDSSGQYDKLVFLCGPYLSIFPGGDVYNPQSAGDWNTRFMTWRSGMIAAGMGWRARTPGQKVFIDSYTVDPVTLRTTFILSAAVTWPVLKNGVPVQVEFPNQRTDLDGRYLVTPTSTNSCTTVLARPASPGRIGGTLTISGSTLVQLNTPSTVSATGAINAENPVSRKRGRPLLVSRGRQPAIVRN